MRKFFLTSVFSILFAGFIVGVTVLYHSYFPAGSGTRSSSSSLKIEELKKQLALANMQVAALREFIQRELAFSGFSSFHQGIRGPPVAAIISKDAACRASNLLLGVVLDEKQPCVEIGNIVEGLAFGTYVFNKPETAYVGVPFRIALTLQTSSNQDVASFFAGLPGRTTEPRSAKWSQSVEAGLRGEDMTVKPEGGQERTATKSEPVSWEWTITPQAGGKKTIVIEVAANILVGDKRNRVQINTLREPIEVTVSNFERVKTYVAGANTFVLAVPPALTALAAIAGFVPSIRTAIRRFWRRLTGRGDSATQGDA